MPYPYNKVNTRKTWLACHPRGVSGAYRTNIMSKTSFITAYGSTARQDVHEKVRYQCTTNSYGPTDSIFEHCHSRCHKDVTQLIEMRIGNETKKAAAANPSLADPLCKKFREEKLAEALRLHEEETKADKSGNFLGWVKIRRRTTGKEILCYPHLYSAGLDEARSLWDLPYKHGWCEVCRNGNTHDCMASPGKNWGWCQPACDEDHLQPEYHEYAHEAAVDAFVYNNCSKGIDPYTEFCTGSPIISGYGQVGAFQINNSVWNK